ncbi:aminotransferase class I/II-fold pyridoxal phosphate-dependent enzyme [Flavobacterium sp. xlx-214]|uniref:aminotransferase class I/II-fold pyridoxal phosphate-dependent enzyme n=1 Tax=unclassified Flavobacterium TaxID=196869 RepID=UPI0013D7A293|nr:MULTISPECIES: aminotransferase class I/II-fold pyridoxal phosphate-dependent enzyme [unclassified Flavobacterium]MBA5791568.1 aminotransferase class I/II-fold pyridoxal phosphate-dependent enzyme [Flavobacterium sp. xlx-221]QMI82817.1 aminotransferase class I/II-fold pyridoxal phosphate-dependent enzyme [Flavobacterium sp. xlx-214]
MAKINHNDIMDTIDVSIENAKDNKVLHLYAQNKFLRGGHLKIDRFELKHFANTGYLGLEQDMRLKQAAVTAIYNFGTQFPLSKTYISHPLYSELEKHLDIIFNRQPLVVTKNSTLAHIGTIPHAVSYDDMVILDHQVHWSVQNACLVLKTKDVPIRLIRHNDMKQLEDYLKKYANKYSKIWYMADGIYSMYGDTLPVSDLKHLMKKYKNLNLYLDDVHGMSWMGINGSGFVKSHWPFLDSRIVLVSTLSKTFGASGSVVVSGDASLINKVRNFGGPLTFSAQLEPASVAAAIASAKIHLSPEIYQLQEQLLLRIHVFQEALVKAKIPLMSTGETPVFFVATGMPTTAYVLAQKLNMERFYVSVAVFPAVPVNNAGLRITVCNHNKIEDIIYLARILEKEYPRALVATGNSYEKVGRAFKRHFVGPEIKEHASRAFFSSFTYDKIDAVKKEEWNVYLKDHALDYDGFSFVEKYFSSLDVKDPNFMEFKYHLVRNLEGEALTQTSISLWKEDMLSKEAVSKKIEEIRVSNPLFLTEKVHSTGSVFTEGNHVYINKKAKHFNWLQRAFFDSMEEVFEHSVCGKLVIRDFRRKSFMYHMTHERGYVTVEMPDSAVFSNFEWNDLLGFEQSLSKRSRRHFRAEVLPFIDTYDVSVVDTLSTSDLEKAYELYLNVKANNIAINNFSYNYDLFQAMNASNLWKFLILKQKGSNDIEGVMFCYVNKTNNSFNPILVGMSNNEPQRLVLYRQLLFQTILFAKQQSFSKIYLGVSAIFEKRKLGAEIFYRSAYARMKDTYNSDLLQTFE